MFTMGTAFRMFECAECRNCGEVREIHCVSDDAISRALGLTNLPRQTDARKALEIWAALHECPPTVAELLEMMGLGD